MRQRTYPVTAAPFTLINQEHALTRDNQPDENAHFNCGEACVAMMLDCFGWLTESNQPYDPDDLKDWRFGQGARNVLSTAEDLMAMLQYFGPVEAAIKYPRDMQNGKDGLLDYEYQALNQTMPVIGLFQWIDVNGKVWPHIAHWRVVMSQTAIDCTSGDPEGGWKRVENYQTHFSRFKGTLIVPL